MTTNGWSSELSKLTANAFLAQRVSSINALSAFCEKTGADVNEISRAIGMDCRIGPKFLKASVGFGGSCLQKDILDLVYIARSYGLPEVADYWSLVIEMNNYQKRRFVENIVQKLFNTVFGKKIAMLGWAFKKDTNDNHESAAIYVADGLLNEHAQLWVYDPKVKPEQVFTDLDYINTRPSEENRKLVKVVNDPYEAMNDSYALAVLIEWDEFKTYDWQKVFEMMKKPAFVFDRRNVLD